MTDRFNYLTVALEQDMRDDDAEALISAIRQMRGVLAVQPHVEDGTGWTAEERVRRELGQRLMDVVYPKRT